MNVLHSWKGEQNYEVDKLGSMACLFSLTLVLGLLRKVIRGICQRSLIMYYYINKLVMWHFILFNTCPQVISGCYIQKASAREQNCEVDKFGSMACLFSLTSGSDVLNNWASKKGSSRDLPEVPELRIAWINLLEDFEVSCDWCFQKLFLFLHSYFM